MKKLIVCIVTSCRSLTLIPPQVKVVTKILVLFIVLTSVSWIAPKKASAQVRVNVSFQVFYDNLSPYGTWVDNSDYGYVWVPRVSHRFYPYGTNGRWVYTRAGWTWFSNYSWGWAPFHYGRWFYDSYYGWVWVPDNEWGPGWVTWRRSQGYYGWAPIGPNISIDIAYSSGYRLPYDRWRFVRDRDFGRTDIYNYYVSTSNYTTIINNSTVINNIQVDNSVKYNAGPERTEVERRVGKTFTPITIKESSKPGENLSNNQLQIYRPAVQKNVSAERKPAPSKVADWKRNQPTKQEPTKQQPTNQEPIKQPTQQQPVRQQPTQQPTQQQPIRQQPTQQPIKQRPIQQQPTQQQPTQQQPNKQQPIKQQPTKQKPSQPQKNIPPKKGKE